MTNDKELNIKLDNSLLKLGKIISYHGLNGAVKAIINIDNKDIILQNNLFLFDGNKFIKEIKITKVSKQVKNHILWTDKWKSIEETEGYIGLDIYLQKSALPKLDYYYHYELIGMKIIHNKQNKGIIKSTYDFGAGDIVENEKGEMFLLDQIDIK